MENEGKMDLGQQVTNLPLVSVIVPCFNYGVFIKDTLQSLVDQTFKDFEVIIWDDGSTDKRTPEILKKLKDEFDDRLKITLILSPEHKTTASARNSAIKVAEGTWILPLDADDALHPQYLEVVVKEAMTNSYDIVYTDTQWFGVVARQFPQKDIITNFEALLQNHPCACTILYRKESWKTVGGYNEDEFFKKGHEDWDFLMRLVLKGGYIRYKHIPYPLFCYRRKMNSRVDLVYQNGGKEKFQQYQRDHF